MRTQQSCIATFSYLDVTHYFLVQGCLHSIFLEVKLMEIAACSHFYVLRCENFWSCQDRVNKGVNIPLNDSGCLFSIILCINAEQLQLKRSVNLRIFNFEKIGSVCDLQDLPATLRTHFFCKLIMLLSLEVGTPPQAKIPNSR